MHALIFEYQVHSPLFENYYAYHGVTQDITQDNSGENNNIMTILTYGLLLVNAHNNFAKMLIVNTNYNIIFYYLLTGRY